MPCWTVRTVQVEFKAQSKDLLLAALKKLGYRYNETNNCITIGNIVINLTKQIVTCQESQQVTVNRIRRAYSEQVVAAVAAKKHWVLKQKSQNEYEARRY